MEKESLFIVIEGLDGSGKTSVARQLAHVLDPVFRGSVKLTFEPHDPSCAGLFIRQILMKKIRDFTPRALALAFAVNRLDHCDREINPWLDNGTGKIVVCDRYYLSSLVYQSSEDFPFSSVMTLNEKARKPDITFFISVSDKVCYERMKIRNQPQELFEKKLSESRFKYSEAIKFLRETSHENIVEIDGSGSIETVVSLIIEEIIKFFPGWISEQAIISYDLAAPRVFTSNGKTAYSIENLLNAFSKNYITESSASSGLFERVCKEIDRQLHALSFEQLESLFLDYIKKLGFFVGDRMPWTDIDCYELAYTLPANITQRGAALLINEPQRYDVIMQSALQLYEMSDFMIVFSPGSPEAVNKYFERDKILYAGGKNNEAVISLSPSIQIITQSDLAEFATQIYMSQTLH